MRFGAKKLAALLAAVEDIYRPAPRAFFPAQLVAALERVFGSEIVAYNAFPAAGGVPLVVSNNGFEHAAAALLQECAPKLPQNPLVAKMLREHEIPGLRISDLMPLRDYQRTEIYNEWYRRVDANYQMACSFLSGSNDVLVGLAINQKRRDFRDEELFIFNLLIPHVRQAFQIARSLDRARVEAAAMSEALEASGSGVVVFDDGLRVSVASASAVALAWRFLRCRPREGVILPEALRGCVRRLLGPAGGEMPAKRSPLRLVSEDGGAVTLRLAFDPERRSHCLMLEAERGIPEVGKLMEQGLTRREAEVTRWTLQGKTNWEVGTILGISARTVEKHLERIYAKLGVGERRHLRERIDEIGI